MIGSDRKHIVFVVENCSVPTDQRVWKEAITAKQKGFDVSVISPCGANTDMLKRETIDGIGIYRYANVYVGTGFTAYLIEYLNYLLKTFFVALRIGLKKRINYFHVANPPDLFFLVFIFFRLSGTKYIFDAHDLFVKAFESKYSYDHRASKKYLVSLLKLVERVNLFFVDYLVVTNQSYLEYFKKEHGFDERRITIVRNAPPLDNRNDYSPVPSLKKYRKHLIVFFGVMGEDDGVNVILDSLNYLIKQRHFTDFYCYLIGPTEAARSSDIENLRKMHQEYDLGNFVEFTGYLDWARIHQILRTGDLGLSPDLFTEQNNLSTMIKIMEYMSHGLPILSFDLKENKYSGGEAAYYCKSFSYQDFGDSILMLLNDADKLKKMSRVGLERYLTNFNWDKSRENLLNLYRSLE